MLGKAVARCILSLLILSLSISVFATTTNLQGGLCQPVGKNNKTQQCVYHVKGESIANPQMTSKLYAITAMSYALCSKALCTVDRNNDKYANCSCPVYLTVKGKTNWQNASVGPKPYELAKPTLIKGRLKTVTSTFSMANLKEPNHPHQVACQFQQKMPWANCFGVKCNVTYAKAGDKTIATANCHCPIVKTKQFASMGPANKRKCYIAANQIWSAATAEQGSHNTAIIKEIYQRFYKKLVVN